MSARKPCTTFRKPINAMLVGKIKTVTPMGSSMIVELLKDWYQPAILLPRPPTDEEWAKIEAMFPPTPSEHFP